MPSIPKVINGVAVEFSPKANNSVDEKIILALKYIIKRDIAPGHALSKIYISSANDQHKFPSRHVQGDGKALDISRVNGKKMSTHYKTNHSVKAITDAIQKKFESYNGRRENFGPLFKKKLGSPHNVSGHKDHIHISVN